MNAFRNILRLSVGDFIAKTLYFLSFVYLARVLGVDSYGVLEFALSLQTYLLLLADGGLEFWATREAAQGRDIRQLVAQVAPLRFGLAIGAFGLLLAVLPLFPDYSQLSLILVLFATTLLVQAVSVKWVFMSQEQMVQVATGLMIAQLVFALAVFGLVRQPAHVVWVPLLRLAGDLAMEGYFWRRFFRQYGRLRFSLSWQGARNILPSSSVMGISQGLGLLSYNFDTVLLGFMVGTSAVSWYNAAYRPITALLAMPVTYFLGLFPALSRTYAEGQDAFREIVTRSLRLVSIFAAPVGVGGLFLAKPMILLLFGSAYANSIPTLQILAWSAALVIMRGTFRQGLNAAGRQAVDVRCASLAVGLNVILNILLIPHYGIIGAATATVITDFIWLALLLFSFSRYVMPVNLLPFLWQPAVAAGVMSVCFLATEPLFWPVRAFAGGVVYFGVLFLLGETEVWSWVQPRRAPIA